MTEAPAPRSRVFTFIVRAFAILGVLSFACIVLLLVGLTCGGGPEDVPDRVVLELRLDTPLSESDAGASSFAAILGESGPTLRETIDALDRAREDDRVAGVVAYLGANAGGMAKTQELRDAIVRFRSSGKFAYAYAETFGEMSAGTQGYYLASVFDEIWLQPSGQVSLVGLMSSSSFYKGTFELLDVEFLGDKRREYKNAFNSYTERRYTPSHEKAVQSLLDELLGQIVAGIASARGASEEDVRGWIEGGPYVASVALERGLVDRLGYKDEVLAAARDRAGDEAALLFAAKYRERLETDEHDEKIAIVYGVGAVMRGPSNVDPLSGSQSMGSTTVSNAIAAAAADVSVKAIVFRVDSPGGSAIASDTIWREVVRAKEAGKPVVVSMGNVAASGGYYVAAGASKIVAQPGTITGSIGVFSGKANLRKLWNKVGVTWDSISTSPNAEAFSEVHGLDAEGWKALQASLDQIYVDFKTKVSDGRGLSMEEVEAIAKGRVWTGTQAIEIGLVDELGGLDTAVDLAKREAGLDSDAEVQWVTYPPSKGWIEELLGDERDNSESVQTEALRVDLERLRSVTRALDDAGLSMRRQGTLEMTPLQLEN